MSNKIYPSSLTDAEWELIKDLLKQSAGRGRKRRVNIRRVVDAIFYILRSGCQYRMLPHDFPPWQTVAYYFMKWSRDGTLEKIHDTLRDQVRQAEKPQERTTASIDSQTTDSAGAQEDRGFDGGKKLEGRKRHIVIDSLGLILAAIVTSADMSDAEAGKKCLDQMDPEDYPKLETIFGDNAYRKEGFPDSVNAWKQDCHLNIISRPEGAEGFVKLPIRWMVERTHAWITKNRRLCRSYEHTTKSELGYVRLAMIRLMLRRLKKGPPQPPFGYRKKLTS